MIQNQQQPQTNPIPVGAKSTQDAKLYTGMIHQGQSQELIEWLLKPEQMIDKFVNTFAGKVYNAKQGTWIWDNPGYKVMNEEGIKYWKGVMSGLLNRNTIMTRYDDYSVIQRLAEPVVARAIIVAELRKDEIGMESSDIDLMREVLSVQVIATLLRGLKGGERDFYNLTTQLKSEVNQPNKGGFLSNLFGKKT